MRENNNQWRFILDGELHTLVFQGQNASGEFMLIVDGSHFELKPKSEDNRLFVNIKICGKDCILSKGMASEDAVLTVDGVQRDYCLDAEAAENVNVIDTPVTISYSEKIKSDKGGMTSFLMLVIFTFINIGLFLFGASLYFPFCAILPQVPTVFGLLGYNESGQIAYAVAGAMLGLLLASIYLILYRLSKKRYTTMPVLIALILMILDTLLVFVMYSSNIMSGLIDIAFHIWVIMSLLSLYRIRRKQKISSEELRWL